MSTSRDGETALELMDDLRGAGRRGRFQTDDGDGLSAYPEAVEGAFGGDVDFAQLIKIYAATTPEEGRRYSPAECMDTRKEVIVGDPDERLISTSHVERHNLTMRMRMRRFTRLTNAFSKKFENPCYAQALYFTYYNFCRPHTTLTKQAGGYRTTPGDGGRGLSNRAHDSPLAIRLGFGITCPSQANAAPTSPAQSRRFQTDTLPWRTSKWAH